MRVHLSKRTLLIPGCVKKRGARSAREKREEQIRDARGDPG